MTEFKHHAYESFENHYREKHMEFVHAELKEKKKEDIEWVCTEKIHGANFQFYCYPSKDDKSDLKIQVGKRKSFITKGVKFFGNSAQLVRSKYDKMVKKLFTLCTQKYENCNGVILFGEIYGGVYPGIESNVKAVQKGIYYCPLYDFFPFDICVRINDPKGVEKTKNKYISFMDFEDLIVKSGFKIYSKILKKGKLHECLKMNIQISSTIPAMHGLPKIKSKGIKNIIEGVVIKPYKEVLYMNGERIILKYKNENFLEVKPKTTKNAKAKPKNSSQNEKVTKIIEDLKRYITTQRVENVISKIGDVTRKDVGRVKMATIKDCLEEFEKDVDWKKQLNKNEQKILQRELGKEVVKVVLQCIK